MEKESIIMEPHTVLGAENRAEVDMDNITIEQGSPVGFGKGHLHAPEQTQEELEDFKEKLPQYVVKVGDKAHGQCIDGRSCACTMAGKETATEVGPKMAGGPLLTAFSAAELIPDYYASDVIDASLENRLDSLAQLLTAAGVKFGGHTTLGAVENIEEKTLVDPDKTGCGAAEKFVESLASIAGRDANVIRVAGPLAANYGADVSEFPTEDVVQSRLGSYSAELPFSAETKEDNGAHCEVLEGSHEEIVVVFNTIKGTTIDRDALVKATGKQVFCVDLWAIDELADSMVIGRPDAETMKPKLLGAMIAFQIATYNELGDGSHPTLMIKRD